MTRHQSRIRALQMLYGITATKESDFEGFIERTTKSFFPKEPKDPFMVLLVLGVLQNRSSLDSMIAGVSHNWPLHRMGFVDLCILRIALFEMNYPERTKTPIKVAINEAVELAKSFGSEQSAAFVNGLLDQLYKSMGQEPPQQL